LALPACRVVRPSIAEYLDFVAPCGVDVGDELGRIELSVAGAIRGKWRWIIGGSCRVPGLCACPSACARSPCTIRPERFSISA
jgi:hypothetical protein